MKKLPPMMNIGTVKPDLRPYRSSAKPAGTLQNILDTAKDEMNTPNCYLSRANASNSIGVIGVSMPIVLPIPKQLYAMV